MSEEPENDTVLTEEEIEALVEHAEEGGFDDGQFRVHDFSAGESLALSKWLELNRLIESHAEALQKAFSSMFDIEVVVEAELPRYLPAPSLSYYGHGNLFSHRF